MSQHMLRIFFADSCVICMIASPGTEMVVNSCGKAAFIIADPPG